MPDNEETETTEPIEEAVITAPIAREADETYAEYVNRLADIGVIKEEDIDRLLALPEPEFEPPPEPPPIAVPPVEVLPVEVKPRIKEAREAGTLPEGFDEYPQELKDAFAVSDYAYNVAVEAYNREMEVQRQAIYDAAHALDVVKDEYGRYDLQKAFDMGLGTKVYEAKALGLFTDEDIVAAQFGAIEARIKAKEAEAIAEKIAKQEQTIADIEQTAPGVMTTKEVTRTIDGVTTTTTVASVVLEEALLAGVSEATLIEAGFGLADITKAKEFVETHTLLPDGWMPNDAIAEVREQSEYGYNILVGQGIDAYNTAISDALAEMAEYERPTGYRLKPAVAAGVEKTTLSLLFPKEAVDDAWKVKRVPIEKVPEVEAKPVSGLPPTLMALPAVGAVTAVPTAGIGPAIVVAVLGGAAVWYTVWGKEIDWGAMWDDITDTFKKETGREPTKTEVAELETTAASIIGATAIPVVGMPQRVALKAAEEPVTLPPFPAIPLDIKPPPFPIIEPILWKPTVVPEVTVTKVGEVPIYEAPPPKPGVIPEVVMPKIVMAQVAVAEADDEIKTIIKPKVLTPSELDAIWNVPLDKKAQALVALDAAVQDAYTAGEIDDDTLRVYYQAKTNYLTKKGLLDASMKAYIGGMEPELVSDVQNLIALALSLVLSNLQEQANQAAIEAYNQAITQGLTETQAQTIAQTAAQQAIETATQTAIQQAIQTATQTAIQTATQTLTKTAAQTATKTLTSSATQTTVQTMVNTAVKTATATITQTAVATVTGIFPIIPPPKVEDKEKKKEVEAGSIAWKMGMFWKYIPPPWDMDKPITLPRGVAPERAKVDGRTPQETIQMIGTSRAVVPESISIDLGIIDAFITGRGRNIEFRGKGLETDVGERLPSPTRGMSVDGAYPGMPVSSGEVRKPSIRTKKPKRKPRRNERDFSDILEVRGEI